MRLFRCLFLIVTSASLTGPTSSELLDSSRNHNLYDFSPEAFDDETWINLDEENAKKPHPLRTGNWRIEGSKNFGLQRFNRDITFFRNGTLSCDGSTGNWWFDVGGLFWDIELSNTTLHHKAELHWNVFGKQPRMFRGIITRDRTKESIFPPWLFRPVVATFRGKGIGEDTIDTSYRHRQTGEEIGIVGRDTKYDRY